MISVTDFNLPLVLTSFVFFLVGAYFLTRTALKVDEKFEGAVLLLLMAFLFHFTAVFLNLRFLSINLNLSNPLWLIDPFLNLIEAGCLLFGAKKFYDALEKR